MDVLFADGDTHALREHLMRRLAAEIEEQAGDYVLNVSETDLVDHFVSKYTVDVPALHEDKIHVHSQDEARIDISRDPGRYFAAPGPHYQTGTRITIAVPYSGDAELFRFRPSRFTLNPPRADVADDELRLVYEGLHLSGPEIKRRYLGDVAEIKEWLEWLRSDFVVYHADLEANVRRHVIQRREKVLVDRNLVEGLGLPIKPRRGEPRSYVVPDVKRKVVTPKPPVTREPYRPEPVIEDATFEEILGLVKSMAQVMERSSSAFQAMSEESLRHQLLVPLNASFAGGATGETFNYEGKTDILIRHGDRNVFIAECKFWSGPRTINETVDQILGYLSWRDTKAAIIVFVRNKKFSDVLDQIVPLVEAHANHKKTLPRADETDYRFIFGQRDDPNRELRLAVLLFAVPAP